MRERETDPRPDVAVTPELTDSSEVVRGRLAPGLYTRSAQKFHSWLLVHGVDFCIEWRDGYDGAWLKGKGRIKEVAESVEPDHGIFWQLYLDGDFSVSVPEDTLPPEGLECYEHKGLEQLLNRLRRSGPPPRPKGMPKKASSSRKKASSRATADAGGPPPAAPLVQRELRGQSYQCE